MKKMKYNFCDIITFFLTETAKMSNIIKELTNISDNVNS